MYEEAALKASSVLSDLCNNKSAEVGEEAPLNDMLESAGMVLVQSLKELGRYHNSFPHFFSRFLFLCYVFILIVPLGVMFHCMPIIFYGCNV